MIDQLLAAPVDAGVTLAGGDPWREVPEALSVAAVGLVVACGTDLRARWAGQDLGGRGEGFVVEVTEHDHRAYADLRPQRTRQLPWPCYRCATGATVTAALIVKGYAEVGDGFGAGVVVSLAIALTYLALGGAGEETALPVLRHASKLAVGGLLLALASGFFLAAGRAAGAAPSRAR